MIGESWTVNSSESNDAEAESLWLRKKSKHYESSPHIKKVLVVFSACSFSNDNSYVSDRKQTHKTPLVLKKKGNNKKK